MEDRRDLEHMLMEGFPAGERQHVAALVQERLATEVDKLRDRDDSQDDGRVEID